MINIRWDKRVYGDLDDIFEGIVNEFNVYLITPLEESRKEARKKMTEIKKMILDLRPDIGHDTGKQSLCGNAIKIRYYYPHNIYFYYVKPENSIVVTRILTDDSWK